MSPRSEALLDLEDPHQLGMHTCEGSKTPGATPYICRMGREINGLGNGINAFRVVLSQLSGLGEDCDCIHVTAVQSGRKAQASPWAQPSRQPLASSKRTVCVCARVCVSCGSCKMEGVPMMVKQAGALGGTRGAPLQ